MPHISILYMGHHGRLKNFQACWEMAAPGAGDPYTLLGVPRDANARQIKKAYRVLALKYHPDKQKTDDEKAEAEKKFQEIGEANEVLSNEELRAKYDRGEDVFENQGGGGGRPGGFHFPFSHFGGGGGGGQHFSFSFG